MTSTKFAARQASLAAPSDRHAPQALAIIGATCALGLLLFASSAFSRDMRCVGEDGRGTQLQIETSAGSLTIALFPEAAPDAVAHLIATLAPPAGANAGDNNSEQSTTGRGAAEHITFSYTRPHIEVRSTAYAAGVSGLPQQIDANALGLHEQRFNTVGEAMNVIQNELLPAFRRTQATGDTSPQLLRWMQAWYDSYEADFLVGASRKEINEALGHSYTSGLESRPVVKGAVALKPASKNTASTVLSIALKDLPERTGKWMVVGEVTKGLDLVDRISVAPLHRPRHVRTRTYEPLNPVAVRNIHMECG